MKKRKVAATLPLLAGMALGAISLTLPFLLANHYVYVENTKQTVDSYLFFFWGKYYTVVGAKMVMSKMIFYSLGDFPVYAMISIIIGLIAGAISIFAGRGVVLGIKGRALKLKLGINPLWLQMASVILILGAYLYINDAKEVLVKALEINGYAVERGPSIDFLLGGLIALIISTIMTGIKIFRGIDNQ